MNLSAIMEHAALSLQPCGLVSNLQTFFWFPVILFFSHSCCQVKDLNFTGVAPPVKIIFRNQQRLVYFAHKFLG